jgi:hypothetical protein
MWPSSSPEQGLQWGQPGVWCFKQGRVHINVLNKCSVWLKWTSCMWGELKWIDHGFAQQAQTIQVALVGSNTINIDPEYSYPSNTTLKLP